MGACGDVSTFSAFDYRPDLAENGGGRWTGPPHPKNKMAFLKLRRGALLPVGCLKSSADVTKVAACKATEDSINALCERAVDVLRVDDPPPDKATNIKEEEVL